MGLEQTINYQLNKYPHIKRLVKRAYQLPMYAISKKIKYEGDIMRLSPNDPNHEYFFGYYDKCPWDASGRYMICMRADNTWREPDPNSTADILLLDTIDGGCRKVACTNVWNVQQGCMAQWLGPDFHNKILYNDLRNEKYCSVILDINTGEEKILGMPIYTVSADGTIALTLDFSRLHNLRPGYGYSALDEENKGIALPDATAIWRIDIKSGGILPLLSYKDFAYFQPRTEMQHQTTVHKVNHLMLSPNGKRFMVLYRWFCGSRKYSRLITCNIYGTDMYLLSDDDMVSHCYWKDDDTIIAFERKHNCGQGYYLMKDKTQDWKRLWPEINDDGHPSYCPTDNDLVVFDTYPNKYRIQQLKIARDTELDIHIIAQVFSPFRYDNDTRCDLHPRWSRDGSKICFDAVFEGNRGLYVVNIK